MKRLPREAWHYAILLVLLLATAAVAVQTTLSFLEGQVPIAARRPVILSIWSLTLGFMLIAGAFSLWAIQFSAEAESRRRVGRFVDAMDFLRDGLLIIDDRGRVTGSNPSARTLAGQEIESGTPVREIFGVLTDDDIQALIESHVPEEFERQIEHPGGNRQYRFRSQPSEDMKLIQISDVTEIDRQQQQHRRVARLQLIGQISTKVAYEFNTVLCSVIGYASLIEHLIPETKDVKSSLDAITRNTEKGIALAGQLIELGKLDHAESASRGLKDHLEMAGESIRTVLNGDWKIDLSVADDIPPVALPGVQVEHVVLNLGLLAADVFPGQGVVRITARQPGQSSLFRVGARYAAVLVVSAENPEQERRAGETTIVEPADEEESGALKSILHSMVEEAGGALDFMTNTQGWPIFRLAIPHGNLLSMHPGEPDLPEALRSYVSQWHVLVAGPVRMQQHLRQHLRDMDLNISTLDNIVTALARIEESKDIDVMFMDEKLLGSDVPGILRAVIKLRPTMGVVVLSDREGTIDSPANEPQAVFASSQADSGQLTRSMIEAKSLAIRRRKD
jgi:signal transduction histidine kinase